MIKKFGILLTVLLISINVIAQRVNAFARVTSISGTTFNVANVEENDDSFEIGERIIVMQMQDNVIGSNTNNNSSFGNLNNIQSAGLYEIRTISGITESSGTPISITLSTSLTNTYNTGANSRVQLISFPTLGSPDYTTTANMTTRNWNGNIGGVTAFEVLGTFTLAHNINADNSGFRGGARDDNNAGNCDNTTYRSAASGAFAGKGEGIYLNTNTTYEEGKGKILNGGGGGNEHNGGGGGGGNYSAGGNGGRGWNCTAPNSAGGLGGIGLSAHIGASRIFMGGGGGGGEGNNAVATDGGRGGGIIIIRANEIVTTGSCGQRTISANGQNSSNAGNDGAGGAGAGGSIVIQVNSWNIAATCEVLVRANGGNGGISNTGNAHGGGGGGGQGTVIYSITQPTTNTTTQTQNGNGGCDNNSSPCNSTTSGGGTGSSDTGIIDEAATGPLPIQLDYFNAIKKVNSVLLEWKTITEINNDFFTVERSLDGKNWETLITEKGQGNSTTERYYSKIDWSPFNGTSYYRLRQTDFNGKSTTHGMQAINREKSSVVRIYPNPAKNEIIIDIDQHEALINIKDLFGNLIYYGSQYSVSNSIDISHLKPGVYIVEVNQKNNSTIRRLVKE